ncbi:hypothetical protein NBZ79_03585 [Sneathiella marina]|uniref:Uncharacterized protein n=1 Tax=Sneathiella marina TaxID=2950108 RepID=A0ABY4W4D5_9PROT|nr:hypothetical protein [Sneathiella marina]USG62055.1 hypothetical protein NBZ79_03585 [Sneathiella marina]
MAGYFVFLFQPIDLRNIYMPLTRTYVNRTYPYYSAAMEFILQEAIAPMMSGPGPHYDFVDNERRMVRRAKEAYNQISKHVQLVIGRGLVEKLYNILPETSVEKINKAIETGWIEKNQSRKKKFGYGMFLPKGKKAKLGESSDFSSLFYDKKFQFFVKNQFEGFLIPLRGIATTLEQNQGEINRLLYAHTLVTNYPRRSLIGSGIMLGFLVALLLLEYFMQTEDDFLNYMTRVSQISIIFSVFLLYWYIIPADIEDFKLTTNENDTIQNTTLYNEASEVFLDTVWERARFHEEEPDKITRKKITELFIEKSRNLTEIANSIGIGTNDVLIDDIVYVILGYLYSMCDVEYKQAIDTTMDDIQALRDKFDKEDAKKDKMREKSWVRFGISKAAKLKNTLTMTIRYARGQTIVTLDTEENSEAENDVTKDPSSLILGSSQPQTEEAPSSTSTIVKKNE